MKKEIKVDPVDVTNDAEMVALGIRKPNVKPRDPSVWTKTDKERRAWKRCRRFPAPTSCWAPPVKVSKFRGRLIIHVRGLDRTTFSHYCLESDVPYTLGKYKNDSCTIVRAFWNGKEIDPERLLGQTV